MTRFRLAGAAAAACLASVCGPGTASAQLSISDKFYEETGSATCSGSSCTIIFTATPAAAPRVIFSKVNCLYYNLSAGALYLVFKLRDTAAGGDRRAEYIPLTGPLRTSDGTGLRYYNAVATTDMLFAPGKIPVITGGTDGAATGSLYCKISGRFE